MTRYRLRPQVDPLLAEELRSKRSGGRGVLNRTFDQSCHVGVSEQSPLDATDGADPSGPNQSIKLFKFT